MRQITRNTLKKYLSYNKNTGVFRWVRSPNWSIMVGETAGYKTKRGYIHIILNKKSYKAHRLAWLYVHGTFPVGAIDHINNIKSDNKFRNLRSASRQENGFNKGKQANNKSGFKGVCWHKPSKKWVAQATLNGKVKYLGAFKNPKKASAVYNAFASENHGKFLNI